MAEPEKPTTVEAPPAASVTVDPPRTDADVWDDRMFMFGAVALAFALVGSIIGLAVWGDPSNPNVSNAISGLLLALGLAMKFFYDRARA